MLQLRKVRFHTPAGQTEPRKFDAPLNPDITVNNIEELLSNLDSILEQIPKKERFNLFCTVGHMDYVISEDVQKERKRTWVKQDYFFFDIDGIKINAKGEFDEEKYLMAIGKALEVDPKKMVVIYTGHGLHVLVKTKKPWTDAGFFKDNRLYYEFACSRINDRIQEYALEGTADRSVFAPGYMVRLPSTLNKKPDKPVHEVRVLNGTCEPIEFDLKKLSGIPHVSDEDQLSRKALTYFKVDDQAVENECLFLKDVKASAGNVDEPLWYAALGIVGRLENGEKLAHEYSKGHRSYSERETTQKVRQAVESAGPRTCDSINSLWGGCDKCPHYKKVSSPISIRGKDFIATAHSGFHLLGKKGSLVPQYDDLRKYYDKEKPYINVAGTHYRFNDTHWEEVEEKWIDNYAQDHFHPPAKNTMRSEFRGLIQCTNLKKVDFFTKSTDRKINLSNGILDIDTQELLDHDPRYGFKQTLDFEYDPSATCPTFDKMLEGITCGDKTLQENLLQFMGYAISNDEPRAQKLLVCTGEGQNGKSTYFEILYKLGGDGVTSLGVSDLANPFHRQALDGALFNVIEEMPSFTKKDFWEDIKGLTTGALVTASKKFKDAYTFKNKAKIILSCNALPRGTDPTHGYFRRLLIVPFNARFEGDNDDKFIAQRVMDSEMPGVLNRVLKAYKQLKANGYQFARSEAIREALEGYKLDVDNVARWCGEHLEFGQPMDGQSGQPGWMRRDSKGRYMALIPEMRKEYASWVESEGEKPVSSVNFTKRLQRWVADEAKKRSVPLDAEYKKAKIDGKKVAVMYGVRWSGESEW